MSGVDAEARLEALRRLVGAQHVLTDPALLAGHLVDPRELYHGRALALVRPGSTAEVVRVVAYCNDVRLPIVPQGGNTGQVGGQIPDASGTEIILSTQRLKAIREIDADAETMIVEAGVTLAEAHAAAQDADRLFPLSIGSEGSCTIGGNVSTNAGGVAVIAYGNMRDLVTGLEVVLADGRVVNALSKLRKDNTGYDLKNLFIGAEGTLGIVTAISLKLFPNPRARSTAFLGLTSPENALSLLRLARARLGAGVTSFELISRPAIELAFTHLGGRDPLASPYPWYVLIEATSHKKEGLEDIVLEFLEAGIEEGLIEDATLAQSTQQRADFWNLRENLAGAQSREGVSIKHDVSVPVSAVPAFLNEATPAAESFVPGSRVIAFGHLGDGNIHFNVMQPRGADRQRYLDLWRPMNDIVHAIVAKYGGSYSAEHGIGQLKRDLLATAKDPAALSLMRQIKATLDPNGVLNPGKVL